MTATRRTRRASYTIGRRLGDFNALTSGDPKKIAKRYANKWLGRHVVSKIWFR